MLNTFNIAIPSKAILAPTIAYIGAFTSLQWSRRRRSEAKVGGGGRRSEAEVGGEGRRRRSEAEVGGQGRWRSSEVGGGGRRRRSEADVDVRVKKLWCSSACGGGRRRRRRRMSMCESESCGVVVLVAAVGGEGGCR